MLRMEVDDSPRQSHRLASIKGDDILELVTCLKKNRERYGKRFMDGVNKVIMIKVFLFICSWEKKLTDVMLFFFSILTLKTKATKYNA